MFDGAEVGSADYYMFDINAHVVISTKDIQLQAGDNYSVEDSFINMTVESRGVKETNKYL